MRAAAPVSVPTPPPPPPAGSAGTDANAAALGLDGQPPEFYDPDADDKDEAWMRKMRRWGCRPARCEAVLLGPVPRKRSSVLRVHLHKTSLPSFCLAQFAFSLLSASCPHPCSPVQIAPLRCHFVMPAVLHDALHRLPAARQV